MNEPTEKALERVIKFGAAFSEVRTQFSYIETIMTMTHFQLNEIAKAAFSVAQVTFEVCDPSCVSEAEVTHDRLALAGTE